MYLLHRKSILECEDEFSKMVHRREEKQIIKKIQTMSNYDCYVLVLDELYKYGEPYKVLDFSSHYCKFHDIIDWFLDENNNGLEFGIDGGDLMMLTYHAKVGQITYIRRTIAISALKLNGQEKVHLSLNREFVKFFQMM
ncbi:MAG: hypothetical protein LUG60_05075 [Erysipelotrichaceae bacterium]|nr:hypothetical protein [Erysipelotrichaceae bacterium]